MSLHTVTEVDDVDVRIYFKNYCLHGIQEGNIYADDSKVDEDGHVYKFSVFDQECNLFQFPANTFLPRLKVGARAYKNVRCKLFGRSKFYGVRPKLTGSHKTIAEELKCHC